MKADFKDVPGGLACDGNCIGGHKGEVWPVLVVGYGKYDEFNYCENAIEADESSGFRVYIRSHRRSGQ